MKEAKKYRSGRLHGVYRCGKYHCIMDKIPRLENNNTPDISGMIISGILNFGNAPQKIQEMISEQVEIIGTELPSIPYDKVNTAKGKFVVDVIRGKLNGSLEYSTEELVRAFYEFIETPTPTTRELAIQSDIRDINRYLECENRKPVFIGHPVVRLFGADFVAEMDFTFQGKQVVTTGKKKVNGKWAAVQEELYVVEGVRVFTSKPKVAENSRIKDVSVKQRLEMYVILKALENSLAVTDAIGYGVSRDKILLKASYYYLQKNREGDNYNADFWGKGGNVASLQVRLPDVESIDAIYKPQFESFLAGEKSDSCSDCRCRVFCNYHEPDIPDKAEEKEEPETLPFLSNAQKTAAEALEGNVRVIATAGSGKTTAMAYRIMNLLKSGVAPEKIGCFTFTNAGAREMKDRIMKFCKISGIQADVEKITISTLHSFGDMLLKKYYKLLGYSEPPVLINNVQRTGLLEKILSDNPPVDGLQDKYKNFYLDMFQAKGILASMVEMFSTIDKGISFKEFMEGYGLSERAAKEVGRMYNQYTKLKKAACLIDHNDQEHGVLELLKIKPDLFDEIGIEHISVDEYQDTSDIQWQILDAMRQNAKSLFIVGDDDQSIYGFRDANVKLIIDFPKMVNAGVKDVNLMENRRSSQDIVNFADSVIGNNGDRIPKHPVSTHGTGKPVLVQTFKNEQENRQFIVDEVEYLINEGYHSRDIAILAATNSELLEYARMLTAKGIDNISINPEPVLENPNVCAAVSFVKFMADGSGMNGACYLNALDKGTFLDKPAEEIQECLEALHDMARSVRTIPALFSVFSALDPSCTDEIYQKFLEGIRTAKNKAVVTGNFKEICRYIMDYSRLGGKETERKEKSYNGVVLSTMHSSKGKEWPVVFCSISKLQGRSMETAEIPEKNRLLFVACTRAKERLYITGVYTGENVFLNECLKIAS